MADAAAGDKPAGKATFIVTIAVLTILAAVGGALVGKLMIAKLRGTPQAVEEPKPAPVIPSDTEVRELPPLVTNLADPPAMRARLQVAIVYDKKGVENASVLGAQIGDDILAFLKTLSIAEVQGASGLQNLREDLNERASVRSQGKVRELIIEAFVVQ